MCLSFNLSVDRGAKEIEVQNLDVLASVPMKAFGRAPASAAPDTPDTLNLSATAAIVAYERQRQRCQGRWWQKLKKWLKKLGKGGIFCKVAR